MDLKPIGNKIVVELLKPTEKTKGGIILPDTAKEKPQEGKVLAVGSGRCISGTKKLPLEVKAGDTVIFSKYGGNEIKLDGKEYIIVDVDDVLATVT